MARGKESFINQDALNFVAGVGIGIGVGIAAVKAREALKQPKKNLAQKKISRPIGEVFPSKTGAMQEVVKREESLQPKAQEQVERESVEESVLKAMQMAKESKKADLEPLRKKGMPAFSKDVMDLLKKNRAGEIAEIPDDEDFVKEVAKGEDFSKDPEGGSKRFWEKADKYISNKITRYIDGFEEFFTEKEGLTLNKDWASPLGEDVYSPQAVRSQFRQVLEEGVEAGEEKAFFDKAEDSARALIRAHARANAIDSLERYLRLNGFPSLSVIYEKSPQDLATSELIVLSGASKPDAEEFDSTYFEKKPRENRIYLGDVKEFTENISALNDEVDQFDSFQDVEDACEKMYVVQADENDSLAQAQKNLLAASQIVKEKVLSGEAAKTEAPPKSNRWIITAGALLAAVGVGAALSGELSEDRETPVGFDSNRVIELINAHIDQKIGEIEALDKNAHDEIINRIGFPEKGATIDDKLNELLRWADEVNKRLDELEEEDIKDDLQNANLNSSRRTAGVFKLSDLDSELVLDLPTAINDAKTQSVQDVNFELVCTDPEGDEHPATADILKVEKAQTGEEIVFRFELKQPVSNNKSLIRPDLAYGIGFMGTDGMTNRVVLVQGAEKTEDINRVSLALANRVDLIQGPADPFNGAELLWEGDNSTVAVTGNTLTFSIPNSQIAEGYVKPFTTEAAGHGNVRTQGFNKDTCEPQVATPTPTPEIPTPSPTPEVPTPTPAPPTPTLIPPVVITPRPETPPTVPREFPRTGGDKTSDELPFLPFALGGVSMLAGLAAINAARRPAVSILEEEDGEEYSLLDRKLTKKRKEKKETVKSR